MEPKIAATMVATVLSEGAGAELAFISESIACASVL